MTEYIREHEIYPIDQVASRQKGLPISVGRLHPIVVLLLVGSSVLFGANASTDEAAQLRADAIRSTGEQIALTIAEAGGWDAWNVALEPFYRELREQCDKADATGQGYLIGPEKSLFTVALTRFAMEHAQGTEQGGQDIRKTTSYAAIVSLHRQLAARSIDLIVVPIPQKEEVYPRSISLSAPTDVPLYPQRYRYMESLLEADVEVVDLLPALVTATSEADTPLFPKADLHWNNRAMGIASEVLALRLSRYNLIPATQTNPYTTKPFRLEAPGPLVSYYLPEGEQAKFEYLVDEGLQVFLPDGAPYEYDSIPDGPVLLIGDSFMMRARSGGSWAARLAYDSGIPVTGYMENQKGAQSAARILARKGPAFFENRQVVILYTVGGMLSRLWFQQELPA